MLQNFQKALLLTTLFAVFAVGLGGSAVAQVTIQSVNAIPLPGIGEAEAYYDAATGDVILAAGGGLLDLRIFNEDFILNGFDNTTSLGNTNTTAIAQIVFSPGAAGSLPSGIFNIGSVLPADPSVTGVASFQSRFGNIQFLPNGSTLTGPLVQFSDGVNESILPFNVVAASVPEPGSLSLLAVLSLGAIARRRR